MAIFLRHKHGCQQHPTSSNTHAIFLRHSYVADTHAIFLRHRLLSCSSKVLNNMAAAAVNFGVSEVNLNKMAGVPLPLLG